LAKQVKNFVIFCFILDNFMGCFSGNHGDRIPFAGDPTGARKISYYILPT